MHARGHVVLSHLHNYSLSALEIISVCVGWQSVIINQHQHPFNLYAFITSLQGRGVRSNLMRSACLCILSVCEHISNTRRQNVTKLSEHDTVGQTLAGEFGRVVFSARCNIYIPRLCYDVSVCLSVCLSVTEVHWRIIANLGFKFRSQFTAHCGRGACGREARDYRREDGALVWICERTERQTNSDIYMCLSQ